MVMGHYLTVSKWRPNFVPSDNEITMTLVWLCSPTLPLELFNETTLMKLEILLVLPSK